MTDSALGRDEQAAILAELTQQAQDMGFYEPQPVVRFATLVALGIQRLSLTRAVLIVIEEHEDEVTASWPEVEAFGAGRSPDEAILALQRDIVALYDDLHDMPDAELGPLLLDHKRILNRMIARREAS